MVESTSHALVNTSHFIIGEIAMGATPPIVNGTEEWNVELSRQCLDSSS
jgi:hypothetical protein